LLLQRFGRNGVAQRTFVGRRIEAYSRSIPESVSRRPIETGFNRLRLIGELRGPFGSSGPEMTRETNFYRDFKMFRRRVFEMAGVAEEFLALQGLLLEKVLLSPYFISLSWNFSTT
jgi:hypothetical protein